MTCESVPKNLKPGDTYTCRCGSQYIAMQTKKGLLWHKILNKSNRQCNL